ncbi:hypothetical protein ACS5PJ_19840 [Pseudarthrobacter sp. YS3]|uniref:hypothetical protein n=1 Tax=Pseudarthrobacter sp. YS3 TaxID=3453718 RepID=UPI003EEC106D
MSDNRAFAPRSPQFGGVPQNRCFAIHSEKSQGGSTERFIGGGALDRGLTDDVVGGYVFEEERH